MEIVSDPTNRQGDDVFVEAREKGTDHVRPVQVPRNVVEMAKNSRSVREIVGDTLIDLGGDAASACRMHDR